MRRTIITAFVFLVFVLVVAASESTQVCGSTQMRESKQVRESIRVKVEANEALDELVKNLEKQFAARWHHVEFVSSGDYDFRVIGISEASLAGAQGTIVVLTNNCEVVTAITRSGRWSRGGAYNAAAKEVVKQMESKGALDGGR